MATDVAITADRWTGQDGHLHAEGSVEADIGADHLRAASADVDAAARTVTLVDGSWDRPGVGTVWFARAVVAWDGAGEASDARFVGSLGDRPLRVVGDRIAWAADGSLVGEGVVVAPCDCERPPYAIKAREVRISAGEAAWDGGVVRILGVPVLPVPDGRIPLSRSSGVLPPTLGYGEDGFRAAVPLYATLGRSADATVTPEVRTALGARGLLEGRYALTGGSGALNAAYGEDVAGWRGAASWDHAAHAASTGLAADVNLSSDAGYLADWSDRFLERRAAWLESRALASAGPAEAWIEGFQLDPSAIQTGGAALEMPVLRAGGAVASLASRVEGSSSVDGTGARFTGSGAVNRPTWMGPLRVDPSLSGAVVGASGIAASDGSFGRAAVELAIPVWRDLASGRETVEPAVQAAIGAGDAPSWEVRPGVDWRRAAAATVDVRAEGVVTSDGIGFASRGSASLGRFAGWYQADELDLVAGGVAWSGGDVSASAFGIRASAGRYGLPDDLRSVGGTVGLTLPSTVRWAGALTADPLVGWSTASLAARWTHPARCLAIGADARWDADEALPTVGVTVDWLP